MPFAAVIGILVLSLVAGCASSSSASVRTVAMVEAPVALPAAPEIPAGPSAPKAVTASSTVSPSILPLPAPMQKSAPQALVAATRPATAKVPDMSIPTPTPIPTAPMAEVSTTTGAHIVPRQRALVPAPVASASQPTLDIASLKARLRDTDAIGVFTKLTLKNKVDDLMQQFRVRYQGEQPADTSALREPYNMLILKVLTLIQDDDPALARMLSSSREAIWNILSDRNEFNKAA